MSTDLGAAEAHNMRETMSAVNGILEANAHQVLIEAYAACNVSKPFFGHIRETVNAQQIQMAVTGMVYHAQQTQIKILGHPAT